MRCLSKVRSLVATLAVFFLLTGCAGIESVVIGSALNLIGDEGADYFRSGKAQKILFQDIHDVDAVVAMSFRSLSYRLEKKQMFADRSLRYLGNIRRPKNVNLKVDLRKVAPGITEVTVVARDDLFLPESGICLLLMKEIMTKAASKQHQQLADGAVIPATVYGTQL